MGLTGFAPPQIGFNWVQNGFFWLLNGLIGFVFFTTSPA
jgi:hypothetical protein